MKISELLTEAALMELSFHGSQCTKDCSGHRAGYAWSQARGGVDAAGPSPSFNKGSAIGTRIVALNRQQAHPQRKRPQKARPTPQAQAQQRVDQGVQGTPDVQLQEFAPSPGFNSGGSGHHMPWHKFAHVIMKFMKSHGFSAHAMPGEGVQFSKQQLEDEHDTEYHADAENVWLQAIVEHQGDGKVNYMLGSVTNGQLDPILDDYNGTVSMDAQGLNHVMLLMEQAFGL